MPLSAESQFLESRRTRAESLRQHTVRRHRTDDLNVFHVAVKTQLSAWNDSLDALCSVHDAAVISESDKRIVHLEICRLQERLKRLQKHSLSTSRGEIQNGEVLELLPTLPDELPLTDLRLLHTEFTNCQRSLDKVRQKLLPEGKFVFRRYREALRKQEAERTNIVSAASSPPLSTPVSKPLAENVLGKATLHDYKDSFIFVYADGQVEVRQKDAHESAAQKLLTVERMPSVLRNIENSHVVL
jgi:hypothetical protein